MTDTTTRPPAPTHILETCLYVRSMSASVSFYKDTLGLIPAITSSRLTTFPLGNTTLILFELGQTENDTVIPPSNNNNSSSTKPDSQNETLTIPGHGPTRDILSLLSQSPTSTAAPSQLHTHFCLAVPSRSDVHQWERHLASSKVPLRGVMDWERGGRSVYFEDPDGHIGEIGSRGIWEHY